MSPGYKDVDYSWIEKLVKQTFQLLCYINKNTIIEFLSIFDIEKIFPSDYRKIRFSYHSYIRLLIFQKLKCIKTQTELVRYLNEHKRERNKLGFIVTPDQTSISYFIIHVLDDNTKHLIEFIVKTIRKESRKQGIVLDIFYRKNKRRKSDPNIYEKTKKLEEICKFFRKELSPFIDLNLGNKCIYKKYQFINFLLHIATKGNYAESGKLEYRRLTNNQCPDSDTLLGYLGRYDSIQEIQKMYIILFEKIWNIAKKANLFKGKVNLAIDYTELFFYGDKTAPMVVGKKSERGTNRCYKFATINIVEAGKRFTLLALPVGPFDTKKEILTILLEYALQRVKINRVYVDRGFFSAESINTFNRFHLKYLTKCIQIPTVKKVLKIVSTPIVIKDFKMADVKFNMIVVTNEKGEKEAFATNETVDENDEKLAQRFCMRYKKRWAIETSYRVIKHSFLAKTTSVNYYIRLFYFLFSVLLYNLWIMVDILLCLSFCGKIKQYHLVTSILFGTIMWTIELDGG